MLKELLLNPSTASRQAVGANLSFIERILKGLKVLSSGVQHLRQLFPYIHKVKDKRKYNTFQDTLFLDINPLKPELNPICYLLALLGAHHFLHVSRIRVKLLTSRLLMSYIYIWSTHS